MGSEAAEDGPGRVVQHGGREEERGTKRVGCEKGGVDEGQFRVRSQNDLPNQSNPPDFLLAVLRERRNGYSITSLNVVYE